jgi:hypothetical protein
VYAVGGGSVTISIFACLAEQTPGYDASMNASAWFMIGVFVLFAVSLTVAAVLGFHRDREVEADGQREGRRRLSLRRGRRRGKIRE